jgi:hypothetical protein
MTKGSKNPLVSAGVALNSENNILKARVKQLENVNAVLEQQLDLARKSKIKLNLIQKKSKKSQDTICRLIIPDSHGCYIDEAAAAAMLADMRVLQPRSIIMLGDHLDCGGFLAQHHTLGFVAELEKTFEDDVGAGNQFLDSIQGAAPGADLEYILGNHETRLDFNYS